MYSFHPSGMNMAMCDGSARFVSQSTEIRMLARLITCAGGEIVEVP
jgi:prepilin-type processing-associated H-X9-DG protein